jgi:methionyl-tRNA synthetase
MSKLKLLVTSALPYANGPIHLGHIAGAYLPADIYVRFNRLLGNDVVYICGTDEHGVPITLRAEKENVTPRTIVQRYHEDIKKAFQRCNIVFDTFSGTSHMHNKHHASLSREFFMYLNKNNLISVKLTDQHFCPKCQRFLADRFIEGSCPRCGFAEARGDECSNCNYQFDPLELKNPKCKICQDAPEIRSTKHWYLRLDVMQKELEKWIAGKTYWKENVVTFVHGWFKQGLKERAITRDLYWGVPVPLEEAAGKVLYVWFDAPIGYISATMEWAEKNGNIDKWKEYWQNPECRVVHFIGKDNIPFHAIIWPAMLMGQRQNYQLPWHIPANEYLNFGFSADDKSVKASKSVGNVVWVHECLDIFPADMVRYCLAACAPEKQDTMFTWKDFQLKCNSELLGVIGNFANRVLKFIANNFNSQVPGSALLSERDKEVLAKIRLTPKEVERLYANFDVRNAVAEIVNLSRLGNQYFDEKAPWKSVKENKRDCEACMFVSIQIVNALAVMLSPVIPESAQKLWEQLGYKDKICKWEQASQEIAPGHTIGTPTGLFQKIEDDVIAPLEEKLASAIQKAAQAAPEAKLAIETKAVETTTATATTPVPAQAQATVASVQPPAATPTGKAKSISLDLFQTLDLRIGEVIEAEKVPKSDKLLKLQVKIGSEMRQVVSGIAKYYTPEQIKGKKVPIILNLEPAKIRGIMSEGMILCADVEGRPVLLLPEQDVPSGAMVK